MNSRGHPGLWASMISSTSCWPTERDIDERRGSGQLDEG